MTRYEQVERAVAGWRISPSSECILFDGPTINGYGNFKHEGEQKRAHRVSFELAFGPIPEGLYICHSCDVRHCINPGHLFAGTQADNMADMVAKGRSVKGRAYRLKGAGSPKARLTEETVRAILLSPLGKTLAARAFGVPRSWVHSIRKGDAWSYVKVDPALIPDRGKGGGYRRGAPT